MPEIASNNARSDDASMPSRGSQHAVAESRAVSLKGLAALALLGLCASMSCSGGADAALHANPQLAGHERRADPLGQKPDDLSLAECQHLLLRTSFGTPRAELGRLRQIGLHRYVDELLDFSEDSVLEAAALAEIEDPTHPERDELVRWWLRAMTKTKRPFKEALAFFWHDHFATSHVNMSNGQRHWMLDHLQLLRKKGGGNLRELLYALTTDQAMLFWLDGYKSTRQAPNENFAREFWELFTLGVDNGYTQADIEEASRAFTGYELRFEPSTSQWKMRWNDARHDGGSKRVFGQTGYFSYKDIVDVTLAQQPVAEFLCARLWSWLCYERPDPAIVSRLAKLLRESGYELRPVLRTILESNGFFSAAARAARVKSPVEYIVGFVRTTGLSMPLTEISRDLERLGQQPTLPPGVDGWPTEGQWLAASAMLQRSNAIHRIVTHRAARDDATLRQLFPPQRRTSEGIVDILIEAMALRVLPGERAAFVALLDHAVVQRSGKLHATPSPFDWRNSTHRDERLRGLFHVMAQHASFHTR